MEITKPKIPTWRSHIKIILSVFIILGVLNAMGKDIELHLSNSPSPEGVVTSLSPDASSFHLIFKNKGKETYYVLKPVNMAGFSCYQLKIKDKNGVTRSLHPQMIEQETTGSAPEPLEIKPGQTSVIKMFLKPRLHARNWNYAHTWGFTRFKPNDTELIVSYTLTRQSDLKWFSNSKNYLKGKAKLEVSSKPILIKASQGGSRQIKKESTNQPAITSEATYIGKRLHNIYAGMKRERVVAVLNDLGEDVSNNFEATTLDQEGNIIESKEWRWSVSNRWIIEPIYSDGKISGFHLNKTPYNSKAEFLRNRISSKSLVFVNSKLTMVDGKILK